VQQGHEDGHGQVNTLLATATKKARRALLLLVPIVLAYAFTSCLVLCRATALLMGLRVWAFLYFCQCLSLSALSALSDSRAPTPQIASSLAKIFAQ
jgi:hypothetical protein